MNTQVKSIVCGVFMSSLLSVSTGCSLLGFSSYPVAHVMTQDTKDVLEQSPKAAAVARELGKEVIPDHFLQPGDELLLEVVSDDFDVRLPADQQIMADGTVDLGRFGRVVVAGLTLEQAELLIQTRIKNTDETSVAVNVRMIEPIHKYYVIGEVNSPGAYRLDGHETVLDGIMEAGGLTARASACDLLLARPTQPCSCRVTLPICYRAITQLGDTTTNYQLKPGDRIFVARQSLCEEMMAYVKADATCERCCKSQTACCDPRTAETRLPAFVPAAVREILPPKVEEDDGRSISDEAVSPEDGFDPIDNDPSQNELLDEPIQAPQGEPAKLDGELDFGMLIR